MGEMVERATQAAAKAMGVVPEEDGKAVAGIVCPEEVARAVIEAIREPTAAMIAKTFVNRPQAYGQIGPLVWKAMIDEALR